MLLVGETAGLYHPAFPKHTYQESVEMAQGYSYPLAPGIMERRLVAVSCGNRMLNGYAWRVGRKVAAYTTSLPALQVISHQGRMAFSSAIPPCPPSLPAPISLSAFRARPADQLIK